MMTAKLRLIALTGVIGIALPLFLAVEVSLAQVLQRTVRGSIDGNCTILTGTGFSVVSIPAGSGGTSLPGLVNVTNGSSTVAASGPDSPQFTTQLVPQQIVEVSGAFYRVSTIVSDTSLQLAVAYTGPSASSVPMIKDMTLFNGCAVTFSPSFRESPAVVVANASNPQQDFQKFGNVVVSNVYIDSSSGGVGPSGFGVFFTPSSPQGPVPPYLPGIANNWSFIAVGR